MKATVVLADTSYVDLIKKIGAYRRDRDIRHGTASYFIWADLLEALTQMTGDGVVELPKGVTFSSYRYVVENATLYDVTLILRSSK